MSTGLHGNNSIDNITYFFHLIKTSILAILTYGLAIKILPNGSNIIKHEKSVWKWCWWCQFGKSTRWVGFLLFMLSVGKKLVDHCLSFGHCIVCALIYGFWLSLLYLQSLKNAVFEGSWISEQTIKTSMLDRAGLNTIYALSTCQT